MWVELTDLSSYEAGDWLSVLGLLLTLIGFGVTIYNVYRAKGAARKAQDAVAEVREDIRRTDMVAEFAAAVAAMEEITRLHRQGAWSILPDRYAALRKSLISIKSANSGMPEHHKAALQSSIQHFRGIQTTVEESLVVKKDPSNVVRLNDIVFEQIDDLHGILTEVKTQIGA